MEINDIALTVMRDPNDPAAIQLQVWIHPLIYGIDIADEAELTHILRELQTVTNSLIYIKKEWERRPK